MATYKEIVDLALEKGYRPRVGKSMALRKNYNDEDILIRLTSIQKWLRDTYSIIVSINPFIDGEQMDRDIPPDEPKDRMWSFYIHINRKFTYDDVDYPSYEESLREAIFKALNYITVKN